MIYYDPKLCLCVLFIKLDTVYKMYFRVPTFASRTLRSAASVLEEHGLWAPIGVLRSGAMCSYTQLAGLTFLSYGYAIGKSSISPW
jgi:hypothetical protein